MRLVRIDTKECCYSVYAGKLRLETAQFTTPLLPEEVEEFRKDHKAFYEKLDALEAAA